MKRINDSSIIYCQPNAALALTKHHTTPVEPGCHWNDGQTEDLEATSR